MTRSFTLHGVTLRAGMHLWSNPARRGTEAALPVVMRAPTLFDLVVLAEEKPVDELERINDRLFADGEISARQRAATHDFLPRIARANRSRSAALR